MQFLQSSLAPDGRFDYRCSLCGRSSWHRGNMKKHMIRMHAKVRMGGGPLGGLGKLFQRGCLGLPERLGTRCSLCGRSSWHRGNRLSNV